MNQQGKNILLRLLAKPVVLCFAGFLVSFFVALLLFFPLDPLARQIEQAALEQKVQLEIGSISTSLPPGVKLGQLILSTPEMADHALKIDQIAFQPRWLSLFSKNPAIAYQLRAYQGSGQGQGARNGQVSLQLKGLRVQESLQPQLPLELSFLLKDADFAGRLPFVGQNKGQVQMTLAEIQLTGMQKLGSSSDLLALGQARLSAEAVGPLIRITAVSVAGPSLSLQGSGSLRLGRTPASSSLNLGLTLTPGAGLDPMLKDLLSLMKKPQRDGSYRITISGNLAGLRMK
ncbi:MAG: type II secretion system protein GspN [Deltaproteobacteria bacterium]|nr:type II secretion system protein GspN [Deltaproteobacteria bacterium]